MTKRFIDRPQPPTALHALAQPLVNRLWEEAQDVKGALAKAGHCPHCYADMNGLDCTRCSYHDSSEFEGGE